MKFRPSVVLRVFVVWTFFVWLVLIKNMITDNEHGVAFRVVHIGLALVSLTLATLSWPLAKRLDKSTSVAVTGSTAAEEDSRSSDINSPV